MMYFWLVILVSVLFIYIVVIAPDVEGSYIPFFIPMSEQQQQLSDLAPSDPPSPPAYPRRNPEIVSAILESVQQKRRKIPEKELEWLKSFDVAWKK